MKRERFLSVLTRNTLLAGVIGAVLVVLLPRQEAAGWAYVDAFAVAFCFTFLGWILEEILLAVPGIEAGAGRLVRLAGWFGGGLWIYEVGRRLWLALGRDTGALPPLVWGGVFCVAMELVAHAALRARGKGNFYSGGQAGS